MKMENVAAAPIGAVDPRAIALRDRKMVALILLGIAGLGLVGCTYFGRLYPHWGFALGAAAFEAALVGGLADWFAVVALFRHPLGLPIPHTAIIPKKKEALGKNLADFVCQNFLGTQEVMDKLRGTDVAELLAKKLSDTALAKLIGDKIAGALPAIVTALDSEDLQRFVHGMVRDGLKKADVSNLAASGLEHLTASGRHHRLIDTALEYIAESLESPATRAKIQKLVSEELWDILSAIGAKAPIARSVTNKLISGTTAFVSEIASDPAHEMRQKIDDELDALIERLKKDKALQERIEQFRDQLLEESELSRYIRNMWSDIAQWVEADVAKDDSVIAERIRCIAIDLGTRLKGDPKMRALLNQMVVELVEPNLDGFREKARDFIVDKINKWSTEDLTRELELGVGTDLQYIRYNGTAIGAIIGAAIYGVLHLVPALPH